MDGWIVHSYFFVWHHDGVWRNWWNSTSHIPINYHQSINWWLQFSSTKEVSVIWSNIIIHFNSWCIEMHSSFCTPSPKQLLQNKTVLLHNSNSRSTGGPHFIHYCNISFNLFEHGQDSILNRVFKDDLQSNTFFTLVYCLTILLPKPIMVTKIIDKSLEQNNHSQWLFDAFGGWGFAFFHHLLQFLRVWVLLQHVHIFAVNLNRARSVRYLV